MSDEIKTNISIAAQKRIPIHIATFEGSMVGYVHLNETDTNQFGLTMYHNLPPVNVVVVDYAKVVSVELLVAF